MSILSTESCHLGGDFWVDEEEKKKTEYITSL